MEDALKKLDKLADEEARMASAQNLKATHNVDERVRIRRWPALMTERPASTVELLLPLIKWPALMAQ